MKQAIAPLQLSWAIQGEYFILTIIAGESPVLQLLLDKVEAANMKQKLDEFVLGAHLVLPDASQLKRL